MDILIKNGRVIDPANNFDKVADVLIADGKIGKIGVNLKADKEKIIDAKNKIVAPGLVDLHCHLREPGREDEETIASGAQAAVKGGFTSIQAMANTQPCCDNQGVAGFVFSEAKKAGLCQVYPVGAISKNREGKELSEMTELKNAGCLSLSDDGEPVANAEMMRRALEYSQMLGLLIISHCEDKDLSAEGVMHEGYISTVLGLRGIPAIAESSQVARDLQLCEMANSPIHIAHVSTKESVDLIRQAKKRKIKVTCETCPHYFSLTDEAVKNFDPNFKVNPPLRAEQDREAIKKGLADGTIDAIATDHAPHSADEKDADFISAPFGIIGLETALSLGIKYLVEEKILTLNQLIEKMTLNPAKILGLTSSRLSQGAPADLVIFDPAAEWKVTKETIVSKSKNTPFLGARLPAVVFSTIWQGKVVYYRE
jgi:dihydroorotase